MWRLLPPPPPGSPRVLVVEDHPATAEALAFYLTRWGYLVTLADTVAAAEAEVRAPARFAAVLVDLMLPERPGYDFLAALKAVGHPAAVAVTTALDAGSEPWRAAAGLADAMFHKPYELDDLKAYLAAVAERDRAEAP